MITSSPPIQTALIDRSRALIRALQAPNGAFPAAPSFSAYRGYCWFRDGSFIADAMSVVGEVHSATAFFDWCAEVLHRHAPRISTVVAAAGRGEQMSDAQMLPARFTLAGDLGADQWWDFQLDGYGTWLWAVAQHLQRHGLEPARWSPAAALTVDYLLATWSRPCYDWWEEHADQVHVSTLGCVAAGLEQAASVGLIDAERAAAARRARDDILALIHDRGVVEGHLVKWLGTDQVDGSLSALIAPMGVVAPTSDLARATRQEIGRQLEVQGGVHRFVADTFYGGGQWPLLSCFLGLAHAAAGDRATAQRLLDWACGTATQGGLVPEQVDAHLLAPDSRAEWLARWGPVATPLLWSHAMILRLAAALDEGVA